MLIRNQEKTALVDITGNIIGVKGTSIVVTSFKTEKPDMVIAVYETLDRAKEVLDNIASCYHCKALVYDMPEH